MFRADSARILCPAAALAILVLAAVLRFHDLALRGLIYWDEAKFALEGIRVETGLLALVGQHVSLAAGKSIGTAKPMHALLLAVAYLAFGVHDYAGLYLNATCSILSVALAMYIALRLFGPTVALVAGLLLATSEYDVIYARSVLSESDAAFLFLCAVAVWLARDLERQNFPRQPARGLTGPLLSGLLCGAAFTVNYRMVVYDAVLVLTDLILVVRVDRRLVWPRLLAWTGAGLFFPVVWQAIDLVAHARHFLLFGHELGGGWFPYYGETIYQIHQGKQSAFRFQPLTYVGWFVVRQGWWQLLLLCFAFVMVAWKRSTQWMIPAALVAVPYLIYTFAPFTVPRNLVAALPFAMMLMAAALWSALARLGPASILAIAAALVLGGASSIGAWQLTAERSGFISAARYVEQHGGSALTSTEIMLFYLRGSGSTCHAPALPHHYDDLGPYATAGYRLAVVERHHFSPVVTLFREQERRLRRYPTIGAVRLGEDLISSENGDPVTQPVRPEYVDVYRIDYVPPLGRHAHFIPCNRDQVT